MSVLPAADPAPPRPEERPGAWEPAADLRRRRLFVLAAAVVLPPLLVVLYRFPPAQSGWYPGCLFHRLTGLPCPRRRGNRQRGSMRKVGTVEPPPAVTFSSGSVATRVRQESTYAPWHTNGAVSNMRSVRSSRPSAQPGNGSFGSVTRSWATYG